MSDVVGENGSSWDVSFPAQFGKAETNYEEETIFCRTIVSVLKLADQGTSIAEITRKIGISEQTYYRWKKTYSGFVSDQVRELK